MPLTRTEEHAAKPTDIGQHLPTLYRLATGLRAQVVIECGVRGGESTVALAEAVHATGGHLYSVDIDPCGDTQALMKRYGFGGRWSFQQMDDLVFAAQWDRAIQVDMVFIDTSHEAVQTERELEAFTPLLRPGGVMAFHDTVSYPDGVMAPIARFVAANPSFGFENHVNCNGLGILRKPGP